MGKNMTWMYAVKKPPQGWMIWGYRLHEEWPVPNPLRPSVCGPPVVVGPILENHFSFPTQATCVAYLPVNIPKTIEIHGFPRKWSTFMVFFSMVLLVDWRVTIFLLLFSAVHTPSFVVFFGWLIIPFSLATILWFKILFLLFQFHLPISPVQSAHVCYPMGLIENGRATQEFDVWSIFPK